MNTWNTPRPEEVPDTSKAEAFPEKVQSLGADQEHLRELVQQWPNPQ